MLITIIAKSLSRNLRPAIQRNLCASPDSLVKVLSLAATAALITCTLCIWGAAQSESGSAAVEGIVSNPDSRPVAGATVTIRNADTGYTRTVVTDCNGHYVAQVMPVGTYIVEASAEGFAKGRYEGIELTVGNRKTLDLSLRLPTVTEGVVVHASRATVEREEMATSLSIGLRSIADLPIRGRNFPEFVKLTPGVVQESDRFGLVISGQRSINSNIAIDGADFNDALQGNQRGSNDPIFFFPQSAVREFQVVRSGATVEVGRTNAGFVNVVTKSGANNWHGEAFYLNRNAALTWPDAFNHSFENAQSQFGGSIGGRIKRDRAFFFVSAEQGLLSIPFFVQFNQQPAGVVVPANLLALQGEKSGTNDPTSVFARTDVTLNNRDSLNVSYLFSRLHAENFSTNSTITSNAVTTDHRREYQSSGLKASLVSVFTPDLLNEARAQMATDNRDEIPNSSSANIQITGLGTLGGDASRPRVFDATRYQVTDNLSVNRGAHQMRVGFDLNINRALQQNTNNIQGRYSFLSLADYVRGKIDRYQQTFPRSGPDDLAPHGTQKELAFYAQDKIALHRDLTLTAGLRWEGQWNPQPAQPNPRIPQTAVIPSDLAQWQPRLGMAWNVGGSATTIVRLSAGLYDARTPAGLALRAFTENGLSTAIVDSRVDNTVLSLVKFPNILTSLPAGIKLGTPSLSGFAPGFRNPRSFQTSATVEHLIGNHLLLTAGYTHNSTWNLTRRVDRNLFPPTIDATGMPIFPTVRPDPTIGRLAVTESSAHSSYDGLVLGVTHRLARRFQFQANYTLARTLDDDSSERESTSLDTALNPFDLSIERSYSKQDVRHDLNVSGLADLPGGFTFSTILMAHSAFPYTPIIGFDTQNDGNNNNDRAIINGHVAKRNSMRGPSFLNLDMRLFKAFRLAEKRHVDLTAEVFNVTRAPNRDFGSSSTSRFGTPSNPNPTAGQPLFAPNTARFGGPRQVQLGVRFVF